MVIHWLISVKHWLTDKMDMAMDWQNDLECNTHVLHLPWRQKFLVFGESFYFEDRDTKIENLKLLNSAELKGCFT